MHGGRGHERDRRERVCLEEQILEQFNKSVSRFVKQLNINELYKEIVSNIHKETDSIDKRINELTKEKEQLINKLSNLYNDKCNGTISTELYKNLSFESEEKLKKINNSIE